MILHPLHITHLEDLPERMNNPFDYEPHPLCITACKELQAYLRQKQEWREEIDKGKMFGVLIVEKPIVEQGELGATKQIGYLAAYSGQIGGRSDWEDFVPAVFDYLQPDGYFKRHETEISCLNVAIDRFSRDEHMRQAKKMVQGLQKERQNTIAQYQEKMKEAKAKRDARRQEASSDGNGLSTEEEQAMIKESQFMKAELRRLKKALSEKTSLEQEYADFQELLLEMKQLRKKHSDALQQWLFSQFRMLNAEGESKDLLEIFKDTAAKIPPAGSGECCEPKLLQYAFEQGLKPIQMAMFWWGESPKEEIRHHLQFYPACNGKCKPILRWMLPEVNEMLDSSILGKTIYNKVETQELQEAKKRVEELELMYEDREIAVVCKPAGMLSVPGKGVNIPSVYSIMRKKYPEATGPLIVHRLDMATSGLMIIAKTEFAYHRLQAQFAHHQVQKRYIAIVCCKDEVAMQLIQKKADEAQNHRGLITLPLMPDYLDRPRQIVSYEQGKEAITEYEVSKSEERRVNSEEFKCCHLRLALYPKTGRTHQLRVHCAHQEGLGAPILGDPLYGNEKANRLYLHAEAIRFQHPLTGKEIYLERKADF